MLWPSDVKAYAERVGTYIETLNQDIISWARSKAPVVFEYKSILRFKFTDPADQSFYDSWTPWYADWWLFKKEKIDEDSMLVPFIVITRWNEIERKETDYKKWRETFVKERKGISAGADIASEKEIKELHEDPTSVWAKVPWGWLTAGLVLIGGALLLGQATTIVKSIRPSAGA